jgi:hypothetical protein
MDYKQLKNEVEQVRRSVSNLLDYLTQRTINDLRARRRSSEVDINDFNRRDNPNIMTSKDFFSIFREEVGVYLFEANFSIYYDKWLNNTANTTYSTSTTSTDAMKQKWFAEINKIWSGVGNTPGFYKRRAEFHYGSEQDNNFRDSWIPLYVGKSKNVQSRIYEHIEGLSAKTYGMKLSHRETLKYGIQFRVSYSPLYELGDDIMYELVKVIENKVRAEFNPIIGKQ